MFRNIGRSKKMIFDDLFWRVLRKTVSTKTVTTFKI